MKLNKQSAKCFLNYFFLRNAYFTYIFQIISSYLSFIGHLLRFLFLLASCWISSICFIHLILIFTLMYAVILSSLYSFQLLVRPSSPFIILLHQMFSAFSSLIVQIFPLQIVLQTTCDLHIQLLSLVLLETNLDLMSNFNNPYFWLPFVIFALT